MMLTIFRSLVIVKDLRYVFAPILTIYIKVAHNELARNLKSYFCGQLCMDTIVLWLKELE